MQMFRKAAVATVILGAGLASTAGVAVAHEHQGGSGKGCSNAVAAQSENGADRTLGDTTGGDQALDASNTCDILNDNVILSGNNAAGGDVVNGDTTTIDETSTETSTVETVTNLVPLLD